MESMTVLFPLAAAAFSYRFHYPKEKKEEKKNKREREKKREPLVYFKYYDPPLNKPTLKMSTETPVICVIRDSDDKSSSSVVKDVQLQQLQHNPFSLSPRPCQRRSQIGGAGSVSSVSQQQIKAKEEENLLKSIKSLNLG